MCGDIGINMATIIDEISIRGLRITHFKQLMHYLSKCEDNKNYYGNTEFFDKRHDDLVYWLGDVIDLLSQDGVKIGKNFEDKP